MRKRLTTFTIVAAMAGQAFGAITVSTSRTRLGVNDRVVLYALSDIPSDQLLVVELRVRSQSANLIFAPVTPGSDPQTIPLTATNVLTATSTRFSSSLFHTIVPGFPTPSNQGPDGETPPPLAAGTRDFEIAGFDGRAEPNRGTDAGSSVNGGLGAAIAAAVVPCGTSVRFSGRIGSESGVLSTFDSQIFGPPPVDPPVFSQSIYTTTVDFGGSAASRSINVPVLVNSTTPQRVDIRVGATPSGFTNFAATPAGGLTPLSATITGLVSRVPNGVYDVPLVIDNFSCITPSATLRITVIPEPATALLASLGTTLVLARRR